MRVSEPRRLRSATPLASLRPGRSRATAVPSWRTGLPGLTAHRVLSRATTTVPHRRGKSGQPKRPDKPGAPIAAAGPEPEPSGRLHAPCGTRRIIIATGMCQIDESKPKRARTASCDTRGSRAPLGPPPVSRRHTLASLLTKVPVFQARGAAWAAGRRSTSLPAEAERLLGNVCLWPSPMVMTICKFFLCSPMALAKVLCHSRSSKGS